MSILICILVTLLVMAILNNFLTMRKCGAFYNTPSYIDNENFQKISVDIYYKKDVQQNKCLTDTDKQNENKILHVIKKELTSFDEIFRDDIFIVYRD